MVRASTAKVGGLGFDPQWLPMHFFLPYVSILIYYQLLTTSSYHQLLLVTKTNHASVCVAYEHTVYVCLYMCMCVWLYLPLSLSPYSLPLSLALSPPLSLSLPSLSSPPPPLSLSLHLVLEPLMTIQGTEELHARRSPTVVMTANGSHVVEGE